MKTIKFIGDDENEKEFAKVVKKNVNNYFKERQISTKANWQMILQTIAMLTIYLAPFILLVTLPMNAWVGILMAVLMGIGMAGIGMSVMHDAVHGSYSSKKWVNKLVGASMYLLGSNVLNWKIQHNVLHHTYTNISGYDQDIESKGPLRLCQHGTLRKIHRYQYIYAFFLYGLMSISKLTQDFTQLLKFNKEGLMQGQASITLEYTKMVFLKVAYLIIILGLPILFSSFSWWQILIGFFCMHLVTGIILSTVFQMAHVVEGTEQPLPNEDGIITTEWAVHELKATSDFARKNHFLNWYIGGLNFQIEHHLFPNICHIHYMKIAPIVEQTATQFGFKYNLKPSFVSALSSHIKRLKELGQ
jgi:linoleoyl-CoA desaturase